MAELVLVLGPCGAGKTTWARATYPHHAHPDAEELARTLYATPDQFRYRPWTRAVASRLLHAAADDLLGRGIDVAVTARGATPAERRPWLDLAARHHTPVHVVRIVVDADLCVRRATADPRRPATARRTWPTVVANWFRDWRPPTSGEGHTTYREISNGDGRP